jgi:putative redox protein
VGRLDHIDCDLEFSGVLSGDQRARLLDIASKCPVHRTLTSEIHIQSRLA